jgi:cobalamin biosynthesis Mg chelatase CobN
VVEEREVVVPGEERMNATHSEIIETSGTHELAATIAMSTEGGETVRTFNFEIGEVELSEDGAEVASSSADPPFDSGEGDTGETADDPERGQEQSGTGGMDLPVVLLGLVTLGILILGAFYWRRRD